MNSKNLISILILVCSLSAVSHTQAQEQQESVVMTMTEPETFLLPIDEEKTIEVFVFKPRGYDPSQPYPVLIVPDADPMLGIFKTMNFLFGVEQTTDPVILVGVPFGKTPEAIWINRTFYFLPDSVGTVNYYGNSLPINNGGGAIQFAHFLNLKVLPVVKEHYNVDPDRIGLAGFSMGGLFATWHLASYPGFFTDYLVISPPLGKPFLRDGFDNAMLLLKKAGFNRSTRIYVGYSEHDIDLARTGAAAWIEEWENADIRNLEFRGREFMGFQHDGGAIPAAIQGYRFLYRTASTEKIDTD